MDWSDYEFTLRNAFLGDTPADYFIELVARTSVLYLLAILLVRFLGKRELAQLAPYEFVVLIAMGSALGDPMFYPDVPVLPPLAVLVTIVLMERAVSRVSRSNMRVESFIEGQRCGSHLRWRGSLRIAAERASLVRRIGHDVARKGDRKPGRRAAGHFGAIRETQRVPIRIFQGTKRSPSRGISPGLVSRAA
jgi:hypothetical protein